MESGSFFGPTPRTERKNPMENNPQRRIENLEAENILLEREVADLRRRKTPPQPKPEIVVAHNTMDGFSNTPCSHPPLDPVIQHCCEARNRVLAEKLAQVPELPTRENPNYDGSFDALIMQYTYSSGLACTLGDEAFRANLPALTSLQNATDYIACVSHGIAIGAIRPTVGQRLLHAAKVALTAFRHDFERNQQKNKKEKELPR
jgi:hypothetical protein